ncbi:MAG: PCMD domain-containing protein [Muribaculaceae bacterium]|nr:PCMD domain-containing protein [Muribaculaceae bacterium]
MTIMRYRFINAAIIMGLAVMMTVTNTSCFGSEPDGCEADIETATLHVDNPGEFFFQLTDSLQAVFSTDSIITFAVRGDADVHELAPTFTLSPGATVTPASGSVHDFSQGPVTYTVTSQDGHWQRRYRVLVVPTLITVADTLFYNFEHYELDPVFNRYYIWYNTLPDGSLGNDWATANDGYRISMGSATAMDYPTTPLLNGYEGAGVCLTTRDTGPFGRMANKRLAAGNMYLGTFDMKIAMSDHLHATRFGIPFTSRPDSFTGYYTFEPGATVQDFYGNPIAGRTDSASIYAVFYRNHDAAGNEVVLYGDNVLSSDLLVAVADLGYVAPTQQWTQWNVKFEYREEVDEQLLANRGYSMAIVFSSSTSGGSFTGAIGSRLCIDKVRLICSHNE